MDKKKFSSGSGSGSCSGSGSGSGCGSVMVTLLPSFTTQRPWSGPNSDFSFTKVLISLNHVLRTICTTAHIKPIEEFLTLLLSARLNCQTLFTPRNPLDSDDGAIIFDPLLEWFARDDFESALLAAGYTLVPSNSSYEKFLPCPLGTYSSLTSGRTEGCKHCPPGTLLASQFRFPRFICR